MWLEYFVIIIFNLINLLFFSNTILGHGVWGGGLGVGWGKTPKSPPRVGLGWGVAPWGLGFKPGVGRGSKVTWRFVNGQKKRAVGLAHQTHTPNPRPTILCSMWVYPCLPPHSTCQPMPNPSPTIPHGLTTSSCTISFHHLFFLFDEALELPDSIDIAAKIPSYNSSQLALISTSLCLNM
ncbi:hypothetical protein Hanom_Chr04g00344591 [Helianthus anomalus]